MKKTALLLLFSIFIANAYSQNNGSRQTPNERAENIVVSLEKEIELSTEKRSEIKNILEGFFTSAKQYRQEQNFSKMKEAKTERDEKIKKLLSADDYQKYLTIMEKNRPKRGGRPS